MGEKGGISNRKVRKKSPFVLKYDRYIYFLPYRISVENRKNENLKVGSWQRCENKLCREKGLEELREINVSEVTTESWEWLAGCPSQRDESAEGKHWPLDGLSLSEEKEKQTRRDSKRAKWNNVMRIHESHNWMGS